jgi:hypothetical protein
MDGINMATITQAAAELSQPKYLVLPARTILLEGGL